MEEILQMSALELSKQIRHGSVSVKEAVEACKKQIQKSESQVHAYVSMDEKILAHRIKEVCLLYTSPSPRDGATSRMPSSA